MPLIDKNAFVKKPVSLSMLIFDLLLHLWMPQIWPVNIELKYRLIDHVSFMHSVADDRLSEYILSSLLLNSQAKFVEKNPNYVGSTHCNYCHGQQGSRSRLSQLCSIMKTSTFPMDMKVILVSAGRHTLRPRTTKIWFEFRA